MHFRVKHEKYVTMQSFTFRFDHTKQILAQYE